MSTVVLEYPQVLNVRFIPASSPGAMCEAPDISPRMALGTRINSRAKMEPVKRVLFFLRARYLHEQSTISSFQAEKKW